MSREHCLKCVKKHIGQAIVLMSEVEIGYKSHRWIAVGHLSEAESESVKKYPKITEIIRRYKKEVEAGKNPIMLPIIELIMRVEGKNFPAETNSMIKIGLDGKETKIDEVKKR